MQSKVDIAEQFNSRQREQDVRAEKQAQRDEDLRFIMSTKTGRRFIWTMLGDSGLYQSSFTGNSETFFKEGLRQGGLRLLAHVTSACPDAYIKMIQEGASC